MDLAGVGRVLPRRDRDRGRGRRFRGHLQGQARPDRPAVRRFRPFVARDDEAHRAIIEAKGKDKRGNGTAGATVTIAAHAGRRRGDRAEVVTDLAVTGKPAQFGRGVMQDVSDKLLGQFVACIEQHLGGEPAAAPVPEATVQDAAEAARHPEIVTEAVPKVLHETGTPLSLAERVERSKAQAAAGAATAQRRPAPAIGAEHDALDLGSAVLPVLIQRYSGYAVAAVVGILIGWLIGRRRS